MSEPIDVNEMSGFDIKEIAQEALKNPEMQQMVKNVMSDPDTLNQYKNFFKSGGGRKSRKKRKKSRKSKRKGGNCKHVKKNGKWVKECKKSKRNFKINKTSRRHSKHMYEARKRFANNPIVAKRATGDKSSKLVGLSMPEEELPLPRRPTGDKSSKLVGLSMPEEESLARQCSGKYFVGKEGFCNSKDKWGLDKVHFDLNPATCCKTKKGGKRKKSRKRRRKSKRRRRKRTRRKRR